MCKTGGERLEGVLRYEGEDKRFEAWSCWDGGVGGGLVIAHVVIRTCPSRAVARLGVFLFATVPQTLHFAPRCAGRAFSFKVSNTMRM